MNYYLNFRASAHWNVPRSVDHLREGRGRLQMAFEVRKQFHDKFQYIFSELIIKCPANATGTTNYCQRSVQCSAALSRFVRFVPGPLAEAMLFCSPTGENELVK